MVGVTDAAGNVLSQYAYLPFGDSAPPSVAACWSGTCGSATGTAFGYAGNAPLVFTDPSGLMAGTAGNAGLSLIQQLNPIGTAEAHVPSADEVQAEEEQTLGVTGPALSKAHDHGPLTLSPLSNIGPAQLTGLALAQSLGRSGESTAGITAPKTAIIIPGSGTTCFPDGLTGTTLIEVKNTAYQTLTRQISDYCISCAANSLFFDLFVRPYGILSALLYKLYGNGTNGTINFVPIP